MAWSFRPRWSLRATLLLMPIAAVGCVAAMWLTEQRALYDRIRLHKSTWFGGYTGGAPPAPVQELDEPPRSLIEWWQLAGRKPLRLHFEMHFPEDVVSLPLNKAAFVHDVEFNLYLTDSDLGPALAGGSFGEVRLRSHRCTSQIFVALGECPYLERVEFWDPGQSDWGEEATPHSPIDERLGALARCQRLRELELQGSRFTSRGGKSLGSLQSLCALTLLDATLNDETIASIASLQHLESLSMSQCLGRVSLRRLGSLPRLRRLEVVNWFIDEDPEWATCTELTDADAEWLVQLPALEELRISPMKLTERGFSRLLDNQSITSIEWEGGLRDSAALAEGRKSDRVLKLYVREKITAACVAALKERLPNVNIVGEVVAE